MVNIFVRIIVDDSLNILYNKNQLDMIDIRADTVTRPNQAMLKIMSQTPCFNDQNLNDYETLRFQEKIAKLFNKDGGVFFLTASMANLAAVLLYTKPGSQIIISSCSHSVARQSSSFTKIAGVTTRQIINESGLFTAQQVKERIRKSTQHVTAPDTDMVFIQNGTFRGRVWDLQVLRQIKTISTQANVKVHIDGARIFNALATYNIQPQSFGEYFDSMTLCFTKGLCCPIGAAIVGPKQIVNKLKSIRKSLGGGLLHTGLLSAGMQYALDNLIPQIKKDNQMAKLLAFELSKIEGIVVKPEQTEINMVHWSVAIPNFNHNAFVQFLSKQSIKIKPFDEDYNDYRFVTHIHIRQKQIQKIIETIVSYITIVKQQ